MTCIAFSSWSKTKYDDDDDDNIIYFYKRVRLDNVPTQASLAQRAKSNGKRPSICLDRDILTSYIVA